MEDMRRVCSAALTPTNPIQTVYPPQHAESKAVASLTTRASAFMPPRPARCVTDTRVCLGALAAVQGSILRQVSGLSGLMSVRPGQRSSPWPPWSSAVTTPGPSTHSTSNIPVTVPYFAGAKEEKGGRERLHGNLYGSLSNEKEEGWMFF